MKEVMKRKGKQKKMTETEKVLRYLSACGWKYDPVKESLTNEKCPKKLLSKEIIAALVERCGNSVSEAIRRLDAWIDGEKEEL